VHLSELRHVLPAIQAMGVDVLFLSGDRPELLYSSLDADTQADIGGLGFTILSDAKAGAAIALGIAFRAADDTIQRRRDKGQDIDGSSMALQGVLPVPSVFAVDTDGIIRFAYSNADYTVRLPADELLAAATGIVPR
jgi:peroxiredoxin